MGVNGLSKLNVQINFLYNLHYERFAMKKHKDILRMQFNMLLKTKEYNENNLPNPNTRRASGEIVTNPSTGVRYRVVG